MTTLFTRLPFLRWSFIRLILGMKKLTTDWQVGDGREQACADFVIKNAKPGDIADSIRAIDEYAYHQKFLINVGDKKGEILDAAIDQAQPKRLLELGAYVGYSALRMALKMPKGAHLYSVEFSPANAKIARSIIAHAGASDLITIIDGYIGDGGKTLKVLRDQYKFTKGSVDLVFIDHAKEAYLPDLKSLMNESFFHSGTVVVADNIKFPGAPDYKAFMESEEGKTWKTISHNTFAEYQDLIHDIVLVSTMM